MKKTVVSFVVAGALLVTVPLASSAAENTNASKVVESHYSVGVNNSTNWNDFIQSILKKYYSHNVQTAPTVQQPSQPKAPEPVEEKPVAQQPSAQQPTEQPKDTTNQASNSLSQFEQEVVTLTNSERAKHGLKPLQIDLKVSEVARHKSADMKSNGYFSHTSPTYGSPFEMMKQFGVQYRAAGENIAMGQRSPQEVVTAWMNSEGHRKNILSSNFTHIGVGHVEGNYWTQMFIGK
ncbi:CAP domain-containing protein [Bacillus sp. PS06]|uniref:CAP domain-containing protein n=1 Tax=Bacillus sp. PS06 TaxID=2764176 RepID=UPI0017831133|nr:CAP domain-containing protein [Bacillus sp. PS06]MBD8070631.1 sporulation protein [Bacillus sp. PS06]